MASILDRYGIRDVCDFTFCQIDANGNAGAPVLFLDSLKVSTVEQTADNVSARGGHGNPEIINWDYNREITVTLEDAVYSAKSMALMFGAVDKDGLPSVKTAGEVLKMLRTFPKSALSVEQGKVCAEIRGSKYELSDLKFYSETGAEVSAEPNALPTDDSFAYGVGSLSVASGHAMTIEISPDTFPGTYYCFGDAYTRSAITGEDEMLQLVFPKAKVQSENTLTFEADGDPSTFSMNLRLLRPENGPMMKIIKYDLENT